MPAYGEQARQIGIRVRDLNISRDPDFYSKIGTKGGSAPHSIRGFQAMPTWKVSLAGQLGGKISRRGKRGQRNSLPQTERRRIRREFEKNYTKLMEIHMEAQG